MKSEKRNRYLYLLLTAGLAAVSIFFLLRTFFLQEYYFLSKGIMSDLVRANLPTYYQLYDNIAAGGSFWTWHIGIGASMFTHADVVMDPFTYLVFLGGRENIPDMFVWIPVCKTVCAAVAAYLYLSWFKLDWRVCVLCANLYALSGIQIFSNNFALGTICVYCPLYLLGIEHLLVKKDWRLAFFSLLATCLYSYYFFYISGLLCAIYLVVRALMLGIKKARQIFLALAVLLGIGLLCVGLSAFILFPQVELASNSVRTTSGKDVELSWDLLKPDWENFFTALSRTFQLNLLGDSVNQKYVGKYGDYFQFTTYITAAAIPLMVQFWMGAGKKARAWFVGIVLLCGVCISVPLFAFVMNSFSTINYRWMFIINLLLALGCALGIQAVIEHRGFYRIPLYLSLIGALEVVLAATYMMRSWADQDVFSDKKAWLCVILVFAFLVLMDLYLSVWGRKAFSIRLISCVAVVTMLLEANANYLPWYHDEPNLMGYHKDESIYEGADAQVVQSLMAEDTGFYRIQKDFDPVVNMDGIESQNDAMAQGYYGLKSYCSLNNPEYTRFLIDMDLACYPFAEFQQEYESQILQIQGTENGTYLILNRQGEALTLQDDSAEALFKPRYDATAAQEWNISINTQDNRLVDIESAQNGKALTSAPRESDGLLSLCVEKQKVKETNTFTLTLMGVSKLDEPREEGKIQDGYYRISLTEDDRLFVTCAQDHSAQIQASVKQLSDLSGAAFNYILGVYDHYDLMSYLGVKYFITQDQSQDLPDYFSLLKEQDGYYIYENHACYPLAFESDQTVSQSDFMTLYGAGKEAVLLNSTVVDDAQEPFDGSLRDVVTLAQEKQQAFTLVSFEGDRVEFELEVSPDAQYLNLTMPYDKDWQIRIDGEIVSAERVNLGLLGVRLTDAQKGRVIHVSLQYKPRAFYLGVAVSVLSFVVLLGLLAADRKLRKSRLSEQKRKATAL